MCVTWLMQKESVWVCNVANTHGSIWLDYMYDMTYSHAWHDLFQIVTCLKRICDMAQLCVSHDSFICAPWLIHMCDMTHSCVRCASRIRVTWLYDMCDMTHSHRVMLHTWMKHGTHVNRVYLSCRCCKCATRHESRWKRRSTCGNFSFLCVCVGVRVCLSVCLSVCLCLCACVRAWKCTTNLIDRGTRLLQKKFSFLFSFHLPDKPRTILKEVFDVPFNLISFIFIS